MAKAIQNMTMQEAKAEAARRNERRRLGLPLDNDLGQGPRFETPIVSHTIGFKAANCCITLLGAPRTKKNHVQWLGKQSVAYNKWCADVCDQLEGFQTLPDRFYNLAATFHVDGYGRNADLVGLLQGLCDALQAAGVVGNDKFFRGFDGSRRRDDDIRNPRVELVITPLADA